MATVTLVKYCCNGVIVLQKQTDKTFDLLTKAIWKPSECWQRNEKLGWFKVSSSSENNFPKLRKRGLICLTKFVIFVNIRLVALSDFKYISQNQTFKKHLKIFCQYFCCLVSKLLLVVWMKEYISCDKITAVHLHLTKTLCLCFYADLGQLAKDLEYLQIFLLLVELLPKEHTRLEQY